MSIARVIHVSGVTGNPPPDALKAVEAIRAADGCEHMYALREGQTDQGLGIVIWRDQAALDAASEVIEAARRVSTLTVESMKVYDVVAER
jgi:hypothetical protein